MVLPISPSTIIAVIGVSRDELKYGRRVWEDLKSKGFEVYGINPNVSELEGEKIYDSLDALPKTPDIVVFVVPPKIAFEILSKKYVCCKDAIFWFQPGSESKEAADFCKSNGLKCIFNRCIMRETSDGGV